MNYYAAFLRGINVGGNKLIKMDDLKKAFEKAGLKKVVTVLASGNVLFESGKSAEALTDLIEDHLSKTFKKEISVVVRSIDELKAIAATDPFGKINVTPQTRLYVTFFYEKPKTIFKMPYSSPDENFKIISQTDKELCSVLTVIPEKNTTDLMIVIDKEFGKKVTTRNWNTICRILKKYP
ncbi:MAG: DUF1697 domain-containing protein [bacterium]